MRVRKKHYQLSYPQKGVLYKEILYPDTCIGNISATLRLNELADFGMLEKAINIFIKKNEGIRLRFYEKDGEMYQYVSEYQDKVIEKLDFSENKEEELFKWDSQFSKISFEVMNKELFQFLMLKLSENSSAIILKIHHLVSDAWSLINTANQIIEYYHCLKNNIEIIDASRPSYIEYLISERNYLSSDRFNKDKCFWNTKLSKLPDLATLKISHTNDNNLVSFRKTFVISKDLTDKIRNFCTKNKVSIFTFFLSVLTLYVSRITSLNDMIFGIPVLNRSNTKEKDTIGMFINTIPIRITTKKDINFVEFNKLILHEWLSTLRHQRYPHELILKELRKKYLGIDKLYDIVLSYQNGQLIKERNLINKARWHFNGYQMESLILHINERDAEGNLILDYDYLQNAFCRNSIEFIHSHIMSIIDEALFYPERNISRINIMSEEERKRILDEFNNNYTEYNSQKTIDVLFEEQVKRTPYNIALSHDGIQLTYNELNRRADILSKKLWCNGVKAEQIIGILVHASIEMFIAILAVIKAGGAFLPLDPKYPEDRIRYMLNDSSCSLVLSSKEIIYNKLKNTKIKYIDIFQEEIKDENRAGISDSMIMPAISSNNLVYVIYTSGTTGKPKGVMIEHRSVHNFFQGITRVMSFSDKSCVLSAATICFDLFIFEVIPTLLTGGRLVLASEYQRTSSLELAKLIKQEGVGIFLGTPSRMQMLLNDERCHPYLSKLSEIMLGGEVLNVSLLNKITEITAARIINCYGPTEATVAISTKVIDDMKQINIGKPIVNNKIYIVDRNLEPVPIGVPGELCVSGDSLARGYVNNLALTEEKFINCPLGKNGDNIRMYRTGDLVRWYPKGEIEYLGRIDQQVKIRGFRIELGEIENRLLEHVEVASSVVVDCVDHNNSKFLCAYYISNIEISSRELKTFLAERLPNYMVPICYKRIKAIPITQGGKINRSLLPKPDSNDFVSRNIVCPKTDIETNICNYWRKLLTNNNIGITDNFYEVGGDSLAMVTLISWVYKEYNTDIPISELKGMVTIKDIINSINKNITLADNGMDKEEIKGKKITRDNFILIKRGHNSKKNIFFLHAGNGEIENYIELCYSIDHSFNCWGIRYSLGEDIYPKNITINKIAKEYVEDLLSIQNKGCFYLAGWCIGGDIAFEMSQILSNMRFNEIKVVLINTIAPNIWKGGVLFNLHTELEFIYDYAPQFINVITISKCKSIEALWDNILNVMYKKPELLYSLLEGLPEEIKKVIPINYLASPRKVVYYINILRTLHNCRILYMPECMNPSRISFINALDDTLIKDKKENLSLWQGYCLNEIKEYYVKGDHHTIFDGTNCKGVADKFNHFIIGSDVKEAGESKKELTDEKEESYIA